MPCRKTKGEMLDMAVESLGSPGLVVHPEIAGKTRCKCYKVDSTLMCFQAGIIGTLSQPQVEAFCKDKEVLTEGPLVDRVKHFREAAKEALEAIKDVPHGQRLDPWLLEMGKALSKRGITV